MLEPDTNEVLILSTKMKTMNGNFQTCHIIRLAQPFTRGCHGISDGLTVYHRFLTGFSNSINIPSVDIYASSFTVTRYQTPQNDDIIGYSRMSATVTVFQTTVARARNSTKKHHEPAMATISCCRSTMNCVLRNSKISFRHLHE